MPKEKRGRKARKKKEADIKKQSLDRSKPTLGALSFDTFYSLLLTKRDFFFQKKKGVWRGKSAKNYDPLQINWLLLSPK